MGLGFLKIQTHTGDDALPVKGADVVIKGDNGSIIYQLTTDASGNTKTVSLYAPDKYHSLDPNDPGPFYSTYEVIITRLGYAKKVVHDVQIFDTIEAILPVNMLPLPLEPTELVDEVTIPPTAIQLPIQKHQVGPSIAPFALNEVVIPDYITVHLGTPTSSARNVRVKFTDYIKNMM